MEWLYLAIVLVCVAAMSRALVTMSFLGFGVGRPLATLVVDVVGATGSSVYALLRKPLSESQLTDAR